MQRTTAAIYKKIFEHISDGVILQSLAGTVLFCNPNAEALLGLNKDQITGKIACDPHWHAVREDGTPFLLFPSEPVVANNSHTSFNICVFKPRGLLTWLSVTIKVLAAEESKPAVVLFMLADISPLKKMEELLRGTSTNCRRFFETVHDCVFVVSVDGGILFCNTAVTRKLGYPQDALLFMNILDFHPESLRAEAKEIFASILRQERNDCPLPLMTQSGSLYPVETRVWAGQWDGHDCFFAFCKDLSVEQELRQRFERLFHNNPVPMALFDCTELQFTDVNISLLKTFSLSRVEILGKTVPEAGGGIFQDYEAVLWQHIQSEPTVKTVDLKIQRRMDACFLDVILSSERIRHQEKQYLLLTLVDVTQLKRTEAALKESHDRLALVLSASRAGFWDWQVTTGAAIFSDRWLEMIGYAPAELGPGSFKLWESLCHPDDCQKADRELQEHFSGRVPNYECEIRMRHKAGHWVYVLATGCVVAWDDEHKPQRMLGIHIDITERKKIELALKHSEEHLRLAAQAGGIGTYVYDLETNEAQYTPGFKKLLGLTLDDEVLLDQDRMFVGLHSEDRAAFLSAALAAIDINGNGSLQIAYRIVLPDAKIRWLQLCARTEFAGEGAARRPWRSLGAVFDITAYMQLKNKLFLLNNDLETQVQEKTQSIVDQTLKLQEMYRTLTHTTRVAILGQLTAALAHEISQPLGTIANKAASGKIHLAQPHLDKEKVHTILSDIVSESHRAGKVIQGICNLVKKETPDNENIDIVGLISEVMALTQHQVALANVAIHNLIDTPKVFIRGNRIQLEQVLLNLITNALDAMKDSSIKNLILKADRSVTDFITIALTNSGPAFDETYFDELIKPFFSTKKNGLGLGLFISRSIVQAHGGELSAYNDPAGVTFCFTLPLVPLEDRHEV